MESALCEIDAKCTQIATETMVLKRIVDDFWGHESRVGCIAKVCSIHKVILITVAMTKEITLSEEQFKKIPYIIDEETVICLRCGKKWTPEYWGDRFKDHPRHGHIPIVCRWCRSRQWRESAYKKKGYYSITSRRILETKKK